MSGKTTVTTTQAILSSCSSSNRQLKELAISVIRILRKVNRWIRPVWDLVSWAPMLYRSKSISVTSVSNISRHSLAKAQPTAIVSTSRPTTQKFGKHKIATITKVWWVRRWGQSRRQVAYFQLNSNSSMLTSAKLLVTSRNMIVIGSDSGRFKPGIAVAWLRLKLPLMRIRHDLSFKLSNSQACLDWVLVRNRSMIRSKMAGTR